jgi:signal transduction histidine kinase
VSRRRGDRRARSGLAFWGGLAVLLAAAVAWRAVQLREAYGEALRTTHALTTPTLVLQVAAWGGARAAHAETVAALLAGDLAGESSGAAPRALLAARFARAMEVLARREGFVSGRVLDAAGAVLVRVSAPGGPRAAAGDTARPATTADTVTADAAAGVRTLAVRCGAGFCAEFHAPVVADGRHVATVVLVAPVDDGTFQPLNASRAGVRTLRTSVLAPFGRAADTLAVVASIGAPDSPEPRPLLAPAAVPAHVRRARAAPPGRLALDSGAGLHGATTHHAVARVPGLDWVLLRELDHAELLDGLRRHLLVEEPILVALVASLAALARHQLRARRARRDQELTRLRADFVASTSHELRTPLAQIRMFAELLQKGALRGPEESARALRIIEKEASRLTILVDNLLNYTRLRRRAEDAAAAEALAPAHVADDVQHVIDAFAPLAAERGARVVSAVPAGLHARVDSAALRQVLINFLENAVKYGPAGQTVTVGAAADARRVRVWVDDEGDGVPPEEREAVWDAFRRGRRAERSAQGGSGIGLAVVRELALQYGGGARVAEAPGGGARFVAEFPRDGAAR